ncbi:hypothetical protein SBA4_1020020 [Candidatus Sulfopaludibacter sp. SbA4]|nr:hypothetical protein SBA4_1020020 [Candidatus Sulfopaludibacter sp. SbA4]
MDVFLVWQRRGAAGVLMDLRKCGSRKENGNKRSFHILTDSALYNNAAPVACFYLKQGATHFTWFGRRAQQAHGCISDI